MVNLGSKSGSAQKRAAPAITADGRGLLIGVRVTPSAPRTLVRGLYGDRLRVSVNAAPEDGKANQALVEALAGWLGLPRASVKVVSGRTGRDKVVAFAEIEEEELRRRLAVLVQDGGIGKGR